MLMDPKTNTMNVSSSMEISSLSPEIQLHSTIIKDMQKHVKHLHSRFSDVFKLMLSRDVNEFL